jgi:hypothetical protein
MSSMKCACRKPFDINTLQSLAFYNSVVEIEYSLKEGEFQNPGGQSKRTLDLYARGRYIVFLGESTPSKFQSFKFKVIPVFNRLSMEERDSLLASDESKRT